MSHTEVRYHIWGNITLGPGAQTTWWFTWGFKSAEWARFDACPDSDNSKIQIVTQWAEKDIHGGVTRWVTFRNNGRTTVAFRPRCIKAPA